MKRLFAILLLMGISTAIYAQDLSKFTDSLMIKYNIPELGYSVISSDKIVELKVLGFHRTDLRNENTRASSLDYFHLGSNTKAITGFVAATLVENNKIKWSTKFFDLFPSWKNSCNPAYYEITLADLLSHRAQIQPYTSGLEYQKLPKFKGDKSEQRRQFSKYLLSEKPVKNIDKIYSYSNAGYSIASLMLEKVSGKSWEQLTHQIMSKNLNVKIVFGWPNKHNINQPFGHWVENGTLKPNPPSMEYNLSLGEPAGDISMTLPDYSKFIRINLQGLLGMDNIIKSSTYNYLHFGLDDYSIGWGNVNKNNIQLSEHSGSAGTFFCYTLLDKKTKIGYVIVANSATQGTQEGVFKLLAKLRKKYGFKDSK
jgi:D-alanyl-D-alanine carboxypeptidase